MSDDLRNSVDAAIHGDARAVEALMQRLLPGLQGFLYRRADDLILKEETPEDLAQSVCREVLVRMQDGRFTFRGDAEFKQWIYEAALLKLRARARFYRAGRRDVRKRNDDTHSFSGHPARVSATPSRIALAEEQKQKVLAALDHLPERDAQILRLAVLEQVTHQQIAQQLDISESHSRVLLSRALARLSKLLAE